MSFHSYRVVLCAPIPTGPRTPDFGSCIISYTFKLHGEDIRGSQALSIPYRDEHQMNLSSMVLLDMWNMLGKNSSVSSEPSRLGGCNKATYS